MATYYGGPQLVNTLFFSGSSTGTIYTVPTGYYAKAYLYLRTNGNNTDTATLTSVSHYHSDSNTTHITSHIAIFPQGTVVSYSESPVVDFRFWSVGIELYKNP